MKKLFKIVFILSMSLNGFTKSGKQKKIGVEEKLKLIDITTGERVLGKSSQRIPTPSDCSLEEWEFKDMVSHNAFYKFDKLQDFADVFITSDRVSVVSPYSDNNFARMGFGNISALGVIHAKGEVGSNLKVMLSTDELIGAASIALGACGGNYSSSPSLSENLGCIYDVEGLDVYTEITNTDLNSDGLLNQLDRDLGARIEIYKRVCLGEPTLSEYIELNNETIIEIHGHVGMMNYNAQICADGETNVQDLILLQAHILSGSPYALKYDINLDGFVNGVDLVHLQSVLLAGGTWCYPYL